MRGLWKVFSSGLVVVLPILITAYIVAWAGASIEDISKRAMLGLFPDLAYVPGLGILASIFTVFVIGLLAKAYLFRLFLTYGDRLLERIPLVSSLYSGSKDIMQFLSQDDTNTPKRAVSVQMAGDIRLIGFVTNNDAAGLFGEVFTDKVSVYLPMSYQLGGFTIYVDRDQLVELDIDAETAMRLTLTGGMKK